MLESREYNRHSHPHPRCFEFLMTSDDGEWNNLYIFIPREELSRIQLRLKSYPFRMVAFAFVLQVVCLRHTIQTLNSWLTLILCFSIHRYIYIQFSTYFLSNTDVLYMQCLIWRSLWTIRNKIK